VLTGRLACEHVNDGFLAGRRDRRVAVKRELTPQWCEVTRWYRAYLALAEREVLDVMEEAGRRKLSIDSWYFDEQRHDDGAAQRQPSRGDGRSFTGHALLLYCRADVKLVAWDSGDM
jgi:hypothetical protein